MSAPDRILRVKIQLDDWRPVIWRRVDVPATASLKALHDLIQAVMPFEGYHLFEFRADDRRYAIPDPEWDSFGTKTVSAKSIRIGSLVERGISQLAYTYDFGDDWRFTIMVEADQEADPTLEYPRFLDGEGRAPPEDVGGLSGFETFLEAMADPQHEEHEDVRRWYGGPFDPADIGHAEILKRVDKLARRRVLGKAGFAKSRGLIQ
ncbi:plasmid pRiA4b ORF-3 family protein [Antarcticirhabdus aurantiaca]|uniref:Plasmid pRiA4b ORF-3 family protein n=1 Tax=Antarcticirhabdus aurantiaca TaxID=2606717 RepID=A0ACD4NLX5_9HYPH|nr:plasmid pRiA4b ORF-3 family protein [Antarcticirhabdus aurantiaca]WAJ27858.1 plasmid pRiA4b ORF-3 family protein [Jeongeuplla avenae]